MREFLKTSYAAMIEEIRQHHVGQDQQAVELFLQRFEAAPIIDKGKMLKELKRHVNVPELSKQERRGLRKVYRNELVKRSILLKVVAAWIITVPVSALMAAMFYFMIRGMLLP